MNEQALRTAHERFRQALREPDPEPVAQRPTPADIEAEAS
jgi:hypothetical protein